jgi:transcriptional regulator with XRE-family HTH domain
VKQDHRLVRVSGPALRYIRRAQRLSQSELAAKVGISQPRIAQIEGAEVSVLRRRTFDALIAALGAPAPVLATHAA